MTDESAFERLIRGMNEPETFSPAVGGSLIRAGRGGEVVNRFLNKNPQAEGGLEKLRKILKSRVAPDDLDEIIGSRRVHGGLHGSGFDRPGGVLSNNESAILGTSDIKSINEPLAQNIQPMSFIEGPKAHITRAPDAMASRMSTMLDQYKPTGYVNPKVDSMHLSGSVEENLIADPATQKLYQFWEKKFGKETADRNLEALADAEVRKSASPNVLKPNAPEQRGRRRRLDTSGFNADEGTGVITDAQGRLLEHY